MAFQKKTNAPDEPPGKQWSIQAEAGDGVTVTLGKYDTKAGAEADLARLSEDEHYRKVRIVAPPEEPEPEPKAEAEEKSA